MDARGYKYLSMCAFGDWETYRLSLPHEWHSLLQDGTNVRTRASSKLPLSNGAEQEYEDEEPNQAIMSPQD